MLAAVAKTGRVAPPGLPEMAFVPARDLVLDFERALPGHANGMTLLARDAAGNLALSEIYYSVGGGFVLTEGDLAHPPIGEDATPVPFPFRTAAMAGIW